MASQNKKKRSLDDEHTSQENISFSMYSKFFVVESRDPDTPVSGVSPFIIQKTIEGLVGTPKTVKKLKNKTLLVELSRETQVDQLKKLQEIGNIKVKTYEHPTLNKSKGIIKDPMLKGCSEDEIVQNLTTQGVVAAKRFKIKKDGKQLNTNTILLTFNTTITPKSLKIFYRIIQVEIYVPNPLRCFCCQKLGHHEDSCSADYEEVCANCGTGNHNHRTKDCMNPSKCVNCGGDHISRSNVCPAWKKEKEILKIKCTMKIQYSEAKKMYESKQESASNYSKIVQSASIKPQTRSLSTQYEEQPCSISYEETLYKKSKKSEPKPSTSKSSEPKPSTSKSPESDSKKVHEQRKSRSTSSHRNVNKASSNRYPKGSNDPIKMANRYSSLEDMQMDIDPSQTFNTKKK